MGVVVAALLILVPFVELIIIVAVADGIGLLPTILLLIGVSVAGAWLLGREGIATWRRLRETLSRGEMPTDEVADGALILFGGALLLTPGFLTDAIGLFFLVPATRAVGKRGLRRLLSGAVFARLGWVGKSAAVGRKAYTVRATRVRRDEGPPSTSSGGSDRPELPPTSPSEERPSDGAGSPDRG